MLNRDEQEHLKKTVISLDNLIDTMESQECYTAICDITGTDTADYGIGEITFVRDIIKDLLKINEIR